MQRKTAYKRIIPIEGINNENCVITAHYNLYTGKKIIKCVRVRHGCSTPVFHFKKKQFKKLYKKVE